MIKAQRTTFAESADSDIYAGEPKGPNQKLLLQEKPRKASGFVDGIQSDLKEIEILEGGIESPYDPFLSSFACKQLQASLPAGVSDNATRIATTF